METWRPIYENDKCIGIGIPQDNAFKEVICTAILPDNDQEYAEQKNLIEYRMCIMALAPQMVRTLTLIANGNLFPIEMAKSMLDSIPCKET